MKLTKLKTFHAIKIGSEERTFFSGSLGFSVDLDVNTSIITIKKDNYKVITSLSNVIFAEAVEIEDRNGQEQSQKDTSGKPKATPTKRKANVGKSRVSKTK